MNLPLSPHHQTAPLPQWQAFLEALATQLNARLDTDSTRLLMRRLGASMAQSSPLPALTLLADLETAMNGIWSTMAWGRVELLDQGSALQITHRGAPVESAFGADSRAWAPAILEGAYEQWLRTAGASNRLRVHQTDASQQGDELVYTFSLAA